MSEMIPCPFCGADNGYVDVIPNPFSNDIYSRGHCIKCDAVGTFYAQSYLEGELRPSFEQMAQMATEKWNTRPIEDELRKRIAELEAERRWRIIADGELPEFGTSILFYDSILEKINKGTCTALDRDKTNLQWITDDGLYYHGNRCEYITRWMLLPTPPEERER